MDQLSENPPFDLNDRRWIIHTRTEERPPVWITQGAEVIDSMITDGCVIGKGAHVERSVLSPGVQIKAGARVVESIILTETVIGAQAVVARAILDKRVKIGEKARVGEITPEPRFTMIGKNSEVPAEMIVEAGAVIATDVVSSDYSADRVRSDENIQTKRLLYDV
jgi:glucose-1-phosphate adenylyltransferase